MSEQNVREEARLRGSTAIVGSAESDIGAVAPGLTALDLIGQATSRALDDAGLTLHDVDGVFGHSAFFPMPTLTISEYLGIRPRFTDSTAVGGSSFIAHLRHATAAINAGMCEVALIVYGSVQRSSARGLVASGQAHTPTYEEHADAVVPATSYALAASRHMHQYGTTREQLAEVAVSAREWARLNTRAFHRAPLTVDEVLASRVVSSPLTVRDCCLVTDGGGAVVVTSAERAPDLCSQPVYILGSAEANWHMSISQMPDLTVTAASESGPRALELAGVTHGEIDVLGLYDAFTINVLLFLEDLGFCERGTAGHFVETGGIRPGGSLPVNTNGGGLSYTHPGMYGIFLITEAVRQLRGRAGEAQVPGARLAMIHGNGGLLSSQVTAVLGTEVPA